jgi:hypothetical protein
MFRLKSKPSSGVIDYNNIVTTQQDALTQYKGYKDVTLRWWETGARPRIPTEYEHLHILPT